MNDLTRPDGCDGSPQFGEEWSIECNLVALRMNNHDSKGPCLAIMLMLKSAISGYKYVTVQLLH